MIHTAALSFSNPPGTEAGISGFICSCKVSAPARLRGWRFEPSMEPREVQPLTFGKDRGAWLL